VVPITDKLTHGIYLLRLTQAGHEASAKGVVLR
jgi:hypothetical protein